MSLTVRIQPAPLTILLSGTRGDLQPLLALARGLHAAGKHVRIVTHARYAAAVHAAGLAYAELPGDPYDLLYDPSYRGALTIGAGLSGIPATLRYLRAVQHFYVRMVAGAAELCRTSSAVLVTLPTFWGRTIAAMQNIPCIQAFLQPLTPTAAFPCVFLPDPTPRGAVYNRISHTLFAAMLQRAWHPALQRAGIRIDPARSAIVDVATPAIYGFSPLIVPRPPDWPDSHRIVGYWFDPPAVQWQPPAELAAFLANGAAPVYIGFGSLLADPPPHLLKTLLQALHLAGLRGILALTNPAVRLPPYALAVGNVPHSRLFPQVAAVVHHGGAGTAAAGLRAGVPTIVVPIGVDNAFWGRRIHELGGGPAPIPLRQLSAPRLAHALREAVEQPDYRFRAAELQAQILAENGVSDGVAYMVSGTSRRYDSPESLHGPRL